MHTNYRFDTVQNTEAAVVCRLWQSLVGTPGCTWDKEYPGIEEAQNDTLNKCLFCLRDSSGNIQAAMSQEPVPELDDLSCWTSSQQPCEIARVAVQKELHGHGLALQLLTSFLSHAAESGYTAVRLLVSPANPAARALYTKSGFCERGFVNKYKRDFICMEKLLP